MNDIAKKHHAAVAWASVMGRIRQEMGSRGAHPAQTVVLVPYAQLMQEARNAWTASSEGAHFVPRFETTMNWTRSLGGFEPSGDDIRLDAAVDTLTAASLLVRAGLAEHQTVLAPRLMEAAWSLAGVAAATAPSERAAWGLDLVLALAAGMDSPVLALEAAVARLALAWAASSSYPSDLLFAAEPGLLVVLEGFSAEPLARALQLRLGERGVGLQLDVVAEASDEFAPVGLALHATQDAEDEAQAAAACVLAHLAEGRSPVALVAVDRVLTRRVRAMLAGTGLAVRDETGWKLSTTRAAASLMGLLRACAWDASTDVVLDWLKNAPVFGGAVMQGAGPNGSAIAQAETQWRKAGLREWRSVPEVPPLATQANAIRDALQRPRPLTDWLCDLRAALQTTGQWGALVADVAGQAVLQALRLPEGQSTEFEDFSARISLSEFTAWVSQTLEAQSFLPTHPADAQVVILPLSQLLGRPLPAVVLPGCDEVRLPASPEPPGDWTPAQRELLGLPSRERLASASRQAWHYALNAPYIDLLWRTSESGERLMPSGFVQELMLQHAPTLSPDPRALRALASVACAMPQPQGDAFPVARLSATAYEDLRRCPYRFFALRQLKLQESDELDGELGKREFGTWLHSLLKRFHEALKQAPASDLIARVAMINIASSEATAELGLSTSEFLPFAAAWPRVRDGYLQWLATHEASGAVFDEGEVWKETPLGAVTLFGKLDRIDRLLDGSAMVIDYKTEGKGVTSERIKAAGEDTQLAFYAALVHDDTLAAAYVNVGEKDATRTYAQADIGVLRDQLIEGILDDMSRIRGGAPMPALGEGKACDFCAARGLCRKDFWQI
jgi:ATP-dependent helicase/nuclease subunit B